MSFDYQTVKLISITKPVCDEIPEGSSAEDLISYCARVSNPSNQSNFESSSKLLAYCIRNKHWSIFEMVDITMEIRTTRDIGRQILRHRTANFQEFCVEENTKIKMKKGKIPIKDLYKLKNSSNPPELKCKIYDQEKKVFDYAEIKEVFETGVKPVYKVILDNGKSITCTKDHKLLTFDGYSTVEKITKNTFVACNGIPLHQDKKWMENAKKIAMVTGGGVPMMAEMANVSYNTIRKWLKKHGIQFTKKEVASYTESWNKGLPKENQPRYGKFVTEEARKKMKNSAKKGKNSNLYVNGNSTGDNKMWRKKVADECSGYKMKLLSEQNYICPISNVPLDKSNCEIDHILPVCFRPDLAFDVSNLRVVHKDAHREKTISEIVESKYTVTYSKVKSITYIGDRQTYDMEIDHTDHNYIADGIVTHNSQRYAEVSDDLVYRECRLQDMKNRQSSLETNNDMLASNWLASQIMVEEEAIKQYKWAIGMGIAKEVARVVLPEGMTMSRMYMKNNLRNWIHYCDLRRGNGTQKEHQDIANKCWNILLENFNFLKDYENDRNKQD